MSSSVLDEAARPLQALLARHPDLAKEHGDLASAEIGDASVQGVADEVEAVVDRLNLDNLNSRASWHAHS